MSLGVNGRDDETFNPEPAFFHFLSIVVIVGFINLLDLLGRYKYMCPTQPNPTIFIVITNEPSYFWSI
jgi:hypothetical protein